MTTRQRQTRSRTTNRSVRFNQLVELTTALSEADKDTKEKVETAEILSLLGFSGAPRKIESTITTPRAVVAPSQQQPQQTARPVRTQQQQGQLPLPAIQHIVAQAPAAPVQQPRQQQQAIRPAVAKLPIKPVAVPVLPAAATAAAKVAAPPATASRTASRSAAQAVEGEKKRKRSKTTPEQLRILMEEFQREPMPNATTRQSLAVRLDMTPRSVQIWFQNMRAKVKKANLGSAPGDEKKSGGGNSNSNSSSPALADAESDGPAKKRQRVAVTQGEEGSDKMVLEQPQSRRNSVTGPSPSAAPVAIPTAAKPQPSATPSATNAAKPQQQQPQVKIAATPQSAFAPANAASSVKPRSAEPPTGKLPLPVIQHLGQPIFGVPLQYIPQSYHCDQLKRATMAALSGSVQQMTA